jgi:hypothetical protein
LKESSLFFLHYFSFFCVNIFCRFSSKLCRIYSQPNPIVCFEPISFRATKQYKKTENSSWRRLIVVHFNLNQSQNRKIYHFSENYINCCYYFRINKYIFIYKHRPAMHRPFIFSIYIHICIRNSI